MNTREAFPMGETKEPIQSEKEIAWNNVRAKVEKVTDALDLGVDKGIKEAVTAFVAHDFTTSQSCEGHVDDIKERGHAFPWVEVYAPDPEGFDEAEGEERERLEHELTIKNLVQRKKLTEFFEEFYKERETPFDVQLTFDRIGAFGGFRVQSTGAELMPLLPMEERVKKIELYRKEMDEFARFLKQKFFAKE